MSEASVTAKPKPLVTALVAGSGVVFLLLLGVVFFVANLLPSPGYPSPFQDLATVELFFEDNRGTVRIQSLALVFASLGLLVFVASVTAWLRAEVVKERRPLLGISFGSGILAAGFVMASAMFAWTLSRPETLDTSSTLRALHDITYLMGGPAHVATIAIFFGVASVAVGGSGLFPEWLRWWGMIGAVVSGLAVVGLIWEPATFLLVLSRLVLGLWVLGVAVISARRWRNGLGPAGRPAMQDRSRSEP